MCLSLEKFTKAVVACDLSLKEEHANHKDELKVHELVLQPLSQIFELSLIRSVILKLLVVNVAEFEAEDDYDDVVNDVRAEVSWLGDPHDNKQKS